MKIKLILCFLAYSGIVHAQWQNTNAASIQVNCVVASGTNVFAGNAGGGVEGSIDNGDSWTICCYNGMTYPYIWSLMIDGTNIFAATGSGVYLSIDSAVNWTQINNGLTDTLVLSLAINGPNLFAGTSNGIFLSTNNGSSWTLVNNGLTNNNVNVLAIDAGNIFAGTAGGGVFLSTDNGANWIAVNNGLTNGNIKSIAISGGKIYVGTYGGGIFLSNNNGTTWAAINNGLLNQYITSFAITGNNIFTGTLGGVYLSTNNGNNWIAVNNGFSSSDVSGLSISGDNIYASIYLDGVWKRPLSEMLGTIPLSPGNLTLIPGNGQMTLNWTDNSSNEEGFFINRSIDSINFTIIDFVLANVTIYTDTGLSYDTLYYYKVSAYNIAGNSIYSNTANGTTLSGINNIGALNSYITIFPNPFSMHTTYQTDNFFNNATLTVNNTFGQVVKQIKNISGQTVFLQRDNLPSGLYFIRLTQDNKLITTDKLVISD